MPYNYDTLYGTPYAINTPATKCTTPAVPTTFTRSSIITHGAGEYDRLKHRADM